MNKIKELLDKLFSLFKKKEEQHFTNRRVYLNDDEVESIIRSQLSVKLSRDFKLHLADKLYYCPSVEYTKSVLSRTSTDERQWIKDRYDCDDFAWTLKNDFVTDAYQNGERRAAHCFGMVWGHLPHPHAINFVINDDQKLRLIEPQTDDLFLPNEKQKSIFMMIT